MADTKNEARERKFETLFDGDEIEGKRYGLGETVTGLDAPTAEYLVRNGRIAEVESEASANDGSDAGGDLTASEQAAADDFAAGRIPDDLLNPDATGDDKLISRKDLDAIAKDETVETSSSMDKADVARAIMAKRASLAS